MQTDVQASMPDTATIQRNTPVSTAGGWGQAFTTVGTTKCHLSPIGPSSEALAADELAAVTKWLLTTPVATDIRPSDRILCNGKTFEVSGGTGNKTWEITRNFYLTEILRT
jgi:hypothetical protein